MSLQKKINICDVSHRDGSYLSDFKVSAEQTKSIVSCIESSGMDSIEVGHGLGISANSFYKPAALSDIEYCKIAKDNVKRAKWGTFCISSRCDQLDVLEVLKYEPDFIKIGCEPELYAHAKQTIHTTVNNSPSTEPILFFMKSYAWKTESLLSAIEDGLKNGVKIAYIVDSAGTMINSEVQTLVYSFLRNFPDLEVGFHGHNNLGMAVSNSVAAIEAGANHVDCSMLGVGRSGGNCCIEQFIFVLQRMGIQTDIDVFALLQFSKNILPSIYPLEHISPLDIIFGRSGFHSAFLSVVREAAIANGVDLHRLSYELSKITYVSTSSEDIETAILASRA